MRKRNKFDRAFSGVEIAIMLSEHDVALVEFRDGSYCVIEINRDPDAWEDDLWDYNADEFSAALEHYQRLVNEPPVPDWNMQSLYDSAHGTINGSDPLIVQWQEEFGNES